MRRAIIGEFHTPETHLIPLAIQAIAGNRPPLTVFGRDYPTPDGTCVRDYVHVSDLVDAHIRGLEHLQSGKESTVFNLGTGRGFSVQEVIDAVQNEAQISLPAKDGPRRAGDCAALVSGSVRAGAVLGWKPEKSNLSQMVKDARRWHSGNGYVS